MGGESYNNKISAGCDDASNPTTQLLTGDIYGDVNAAGSDPRWKRALNDGVTTLNNKDDGVDWLPQNAGIPNGSTWPISFAIENHPESKSKITFDSGSYTQTCWFGESWPTGQGLDVLFNLDTAAETVNFDAFIAEYW